MFTRYEHVDQAPLTFHPTRQYRSAIIARACYYDSGAPVADRARTAASAAAAMQPAGEIPVMEALACRAYAVLGRESLAIPRGIAAAAWMLGAVPVYLLATRLAAHAGFVAMAIYLFLPYGVEASRSFQPDPLMTCCALWALLATVRYDERPAAGRMVLAVAAIAIAALVKPMSVFLTIPVAAALAFGRPRAWALPALGVLPAALYYGYEAVFGTLARDQMHMRFVPDLLTSSFFWSGWWTQIRRVFGVPFFVAAIAGLVVARGRARLWLAALWAGYVLFAIAFTYHMPTHDYYHLPFIAVVGLSSAALVRLLDTRLAIAATLAVAAFGLIAATRTSPPAADGRVAMYEEIGELVQHETRVLFLDSDYGYPLMYHGHMSGESWPNADDLRAEALGGRAVIDARDRFARDFAHPRPKYVVITDMESFAEQPDLQRLLDRFARLVRSTTRYRVYEYGVVTLASREGS